MKNRAQITLVATGKKTRRQTNEFSKNAEIQLSPKRANFARGEAFWGTSPVVAARVGGQESTRGHSRNCRDSPAVFADVTASVFRFVNVVTRSDIVYNIPIETEMAMDDVPVASSSTYCYNWAFPAARSEWGDNTQIGLGEIWMRT